MSRVVAKKDHFGPKKPLDPKTVEWPDAYGDTLVYVTCSCCHKALMLGTKLIVVSTSGVIHEGCLESWVKLNGLKIKEPKLKKRS